VTLGSHGPTIAGPADWHPGPVRIAVTSRIPDQELVLLHFLPGYSYARFQADGALAQGHTPAARTALARVFAHTIFDGGVNVSPRRQMQLTYNLPAGEYAILDFNHDMKTGRPDTLEGLYAIATLR
jgi:hypothetical protein